MTKPTTPYVVAFGNPAIVVKCGVGKPAAFTTTTDSQVFSVADNAGAFYWVDHDGGANVYTAIDRQAYVSFTIPGTYSAADYLPILNAAVVKAMPKQVCLPDAGAVSTKIPSSDLCGARK